MNQRQVIPIFAEAKAAPVIHRPAAIVQASLSGADAMVGAVQLRTLAYAAPAGGARDLLLRLATALEQAK